MKNMMYSMMMGVSVMMAAAPVYAAPDTPDMETAQRAAADIVVDVNGLVCDFCAQAVTKVFKKQDAVDDVVVDLSAKKITVWLKDGQHMADDVVKKLVEDAGYNVVQIHMKE